MLFGTASVSAVCLRRPLSPDTRSGAESTATIQRNKALDIYASACGHFGVMPKTDTTKLLVEQAISQLRATSAALAALKQEMQSLAASLPEYPVVMGMFGVGPSLGPQLMAEIGDVRRFHSKKALVAFAGIDAPPYQSGQMDVRSRSISKRGSASLRRALFLVMGVILQCAPGMNRFISS